MTRLGSEPGRCGAGPRRRRDGEGAGFTLIELIIVTAVMGIVLTAMTAALITTMRAAPDTEARLDDARTTRFLSTWMAHDTTSTPPFHPEKEQVGLWSGIDVATSPTATNNDCNGLGDNLLHLQWTEDAAATTVHVANYRFVDDGTTAVVRRYACSKPAAAPSFTLTFDRALTPPLDPTNPPTVTLDQPSPADDVRSVTFTLNGVGGEIVLVETASRNPAQFFP